MPTIKYVSWKPNRSSIEIVDHANEILREYNEQGYDLSLRQLYYQFVARDLIPNSQKSYNRLGNIISKARDAGMVDWFDIEDRGRSIYGFPHYDSGEQFLESVVDRFHLDLWQGQPVKVQVWVEKDALSDVVSRAASRFDCPYFACKGYVSASAMWSAAQSMLKDECNDWVILHLGDHDPSGIDMTRDIQERMALYAKPWRRSHEETVIGVKRIALNMDQVEEYQPPPNPAKETDSRFESYLIEHGDESWELDALNPDTIVTLIETEIQDLMVDDDSYYERRELQERIRQELRDVELEN